MVFADHFSRMICPPGFTGSFETASTLAVAELLGVEEFRRSFVEIKDAYNEGAQGDPSMFNVIGKRCADWLQAPTDENFQKLVELINVFRKDKISDEQGRLLT